MKITRTGTAVLGVLALAVGAIAFTAPTASADQGNQEWLSWDGSNAYYLGGPTAAQASTAGGNWTGDIYNYYSGKCLEVPYSDMFGSATNPAFSGADADGSPVDQSACTPTWEGWRAANQEWAQVDNQDPDHTWSYFVANDGTYVSGGNNYVPATWPENPYGPFFYCLDSLGGHNYDGSPIEVWRCDGINPQKWTIGPQSQLQAYGAPGKCLDDTNWGTSDGNPMQLWDCAL